MAGCDLAASEAGEEVRVDPHDGQPCTFEGLLEKYRGRYLHPEVLVWWRVRCKPTTSLGSAVTPLHFAWPKHWGEEARSDRGKHRDGLQLEESCASIPRLPLPPLELIEESCGPQGDWPLSYAMQTLPGHRLRDAVENARRRPPSVLAELPRCRFRVINLPDERGAKRRHHIDQSCMLPLRHHFPGIDAGYTDGIVAKDLVWTDLPGADRRPHFEKEIMYNGQRYVADQALWHVPTRNEQNVMTVNGQRDGFIREQFHAFLKGEDEPCSWGYTGCQLAHVEAWRAAYAAGVDWLMISEDDVLPIPLFGMDWADIWGVIAHEIHLLRQANEEWDLLYIGKGSATSAEGPFVTPLVIRAGYNLKMHCYCLSRRGLERMLAAPLSYSSIRPQDEILAALSIQGRHPRDCISERIRAGFPKASEFRSLAFAFWGIVFQLQQFKLLHSCSHLCDESVAESAIHREGDLAAKSGFGTDGISG
eukprot:NODE_5806_length_1733_cov_7.801993.p1 GENE.NODE_5806_length_1733_cov_7.801993~~NODE_5806_length_1733_cov_7.801993.p1  ORF type:complete len:476 (-),score=84.74 NODE_5806_length_1733_cov_7.801993:182-1609(-)